MNPKVSLVISVNNIDEDFINNCLKSVLNQSLYDIEIICACSNSVNDLNNYVNDNRIKVFNYDTDSLEYLKNKGLDHATGEYVSFIKHNDWIDLDFCKNLYSKAHKSDLDVLIFKLLDYDNNQFYNDYFYDFSIFENNLLNHTFSHRDIEDILFLIPQCTYNKFYKTQFLKENNINFNNQIFDDVTFFFNIILKANKIALYGDYIYYRKISEEANSIDDNILKDIVDITNEIILVFKECNLYEEYKRQLYNYKIELIRYWYSLSNDFIKLNSFEYIQRDFLSINDEFFISNIKHLLTKNNLMFFNNFRLCFSKFELDLIYENNNLKLCNEKLVEELNKYKK